MKTLLSALAVVALMAAPVLAETIILQENFDGDVGTPVADGVTGWTGNSNIVRSGTVLDQGNSADWPSEPAWPQLKKSLNHTPVAGEIYTLTATIYSPAPSGTDVVIVLRNSQDPTQQVAGAEMGYGDLHFGVPNVGYWAPVIAPQPLTATDVKLVLQGNQADMYYRENGAPGWTFVGQKTDIGYSIAVYDELMIGGHGGLAGGIDSVLLTSTVVPEPTAIVLLGTGLIGLLAYVWRKRK
jgi:hypothetical protein